MTNLTDIPAAELLPELAGYLRSTPELGVILQHPLVYSIGYTPLHNHRYNEQYRAKLAALDEARAQRRWHSYVFLHERAYRIPALDELFIEIPDAEFWPLAGDVLTDSENIHQHYDVVGVWLDQPAVPPSIMNEDEQQEFAALPDTFTVYRGYSKDESPENPQDWSWTRSLETAQWFANRWDQNGAIITGTIKKRDVMALFTRRGESEILTWPEKISGKRSVTLSPEDQ